jgi:hypothetical protein
MEDCGGQLYLKIYCGYGSLLELLIGDRATEVGDPL